MAVPDNFIIDDANKEADQSEFVANRSSLQSQVQSQMQMLRSNQGSNSFRTYQINASEEFGDFKMPVQQSQMLNNPQNPFLKSNTGQASQPASKKRSSDEMKEQYQRFVDAGTYKKPQRNKQKLERKLFQSPQQKQKQAVNEQMLQREGPKEMGKSAKKLGSGLTDLVNQNPEEDVRMEHSQSKRKFKSSSKKNR